MTLDEQLVAARDKCAAIRRDLVRRVVEEPGDPLWAIMLDRMNETIRDLDEELD